MALKNKSRKKQTQLAFAPLPTSSPSADILSSAVKDRAAHVRYNVTPSSARYRTASSMGATPMNLNVATQPIEKARAKASPSRDWLNTEGLPTPKPSSQLDGAYSEPPDHEGIITSSDDDSYRLPPAPAPRRRRQRLPADREPKRNSTAFFSQRERSPITVPLPLHSSPRSAAKTQNSLFKGSPRDIKEKETPSKEATRRKSKSVHTEPSQSDEDDPDDIPPVPSSTRRRSRASTQAVIISSDDNDDSDATSDSAATRDKMLKKLESETKDGSAKPGASVSNSIVQMAQCKHLSSPYASAEHFLLSNFNDAVGATYSHQYKADTSPRQSPIRRSLRTNKQSDSYKSTEELPSQSKRPTTRSSAANGSYTSSIPKRKSSAIDLALDIESEDSGGEFQQPSFLPAKKITRPIEIASDEDSDSEEIVHSSRRSKKHNLSDESSGEDSEIASPTKRRRRQVSTSGEEANSVPRQTSTRELEDLKEDLDFLNDSDGPSGTPTKKISEKEQRRINLEKMKARREKKSQPTTVNVDSDADEARSNSDTEAEEVNDDDFHLGRLLNEDSYDEGFVEDDTATADKSVLVDMPLEFTRHANEGAKHHFKFVIEWMVHKKLNPGFSRDDPIYRMAFRKVDDEARGLASSKLTSSTWKPEFLRALGARPIFTEVDVSGPSGFLKPHCMACNRTGHSASFKVTLSGKAYYPDTLENLKEEGDSSADDSDSDDSDDGASVDINGQALPDENHEFWLGSFCKANSSRAHALLHWKWHLYDWVLDWLNASGYTSPEHIVERETWSDKRRTKYAHKVVDEMAGEDGEIKRLWRDFKAQLGAARDQKLYYGR